MSRMTLCQQYKLFLTRESDADFVMMFGEQTLSNFKKYIEAIKLQEKTGCSFTCLAKQLNVHTTHLIRQGEAYKKALELLETQTQRG